PIVDAVWPFDDDDVADVAGVDLADDGVEVEASGHPVAAIGGDVDLAHGLAADARVGHDRVAVLNDNAGVVERLAEQAADVGGVTGLRLTAANDVGAGGGDDGRIGPGGGRGSGIATNGAEGGGWRGSERCHRRRSHGGGNGSCRRG